MAENHVIVEAKSEKPMANLSIDVTKFQICSAKTNR